MTQLLLVHTIISFSQANIELTKLYNWLCLNKLSLNIDKTSYILFSNKQDDPKNTINIDSINIKRVFSNKFLGVTIVHKFSWKTQIADVCKKVSRCTGILNKVKSILSTKIIIIIMVIFRCYFSREHIALSYKKWCGHITRKNQQIKSTVHDGKSYLK